MHLVGRRDLLLGGLALGLVGCSASPPAPTPLVVTPPATPPTPLVTTTPPAPPTPDGVPDHSAAPSAPATPPPTSVWTARVMTWNMLTSNLSGSHFRAVVKDSDVRLANRAPRMAEWIRDADPDIIGLQENEANPPHRLPLSALAPLLPRYQALLPGLNVPLLVKRDRFIVQGVGSTDISQGHYSRHVAWFRLRHHGTGREILVANTHLDPYQRRYMATARATETEEILQLLRQLNPSWRIPTLLLGDLNVRADESRPEFAVPLARLAAAELRDGVRLSTNDISRVRGAASLNSFGAKVGGRWRYRAIRTDGFRYDYVFVSSAVRVVDWQVVTGPGVRMIDGHPFFADGPVPSDHCPVQLTLEFPS